MTPLISVLTLSRLHFPPLSFCSVCVCVCACVCVLYPTVFAMLQCYNTMCGLGRALTSCMRPSIVIMHGKLLSIARTVTPKQNMLSEVTGVPGILGRSCTVIPTMLYKVKYIP